MKNASIYIFFAFVAFLFQTTVLPELFSVLDMMLGGRFFSTLSLPIITIFIIYISFTRNLLNALTWSCFLSFLFHGFGELWKYSNFFMFFTIVFFGSILKNRLVIDHKMNAFIFFFVFLFFGQWSYLFFSNLLFDFEFSFFHYFWIFTSNSFVGSFLSFGLTKLFSYIDQKTFFFRDPKANFFYREGLL
ncbi:MAG: hypothetical protein KDD52_05470 [Bdellovibrionales bacterium]|nr:hypothetical protein [Bdellovibrionales bacterium]